VATLLVSVRLVKVQPPSGSVATAVLAVLFLTVAAGAALQSATGFGFSLLAAPLLFAVIDPQPAVGLLAVLGLVHNGLTLLTEGRRPRPLTDEVVRLVGWALPGALLGVVVLRSLDGVVLQLLLSVGVIVTLVARHALTQRGAVVPVLATGPRPRPPWAAPVAGLVSGGLSTSLSTNGPPLLLYLLGRGARPSVVRDTLTACFFALGLITPIALLVTRSTEAVPEARHVAVLLPATIAGHLSGRPLFARLAHGPHYELVVTVVLLVSVAIGLISVVA
jgi:hypothetical protein